LQIETNSKRCREPGRLSRFSSHVSSSFIRFFSVFDLEEKKNNLNNNNNNNLNNSSSPSPPLLLPSACPGTRLFRLRSLLSEVRKRDIGEIELKKE